MIQPCITIPRIVPNYYWATTSGLLLFIVNPQSIYKLLDLYYLSDTIWTQTVIRVTTTTAAAAAAAAATATATATATVSASTLLVY